jgi:hypothetical protein
VSAEAGRTGPHAADQAREVQRKTSFRERGRISDLCGESAGTLILLLLDPELRPSAHTPLRRRPRGARKTPRSYHAVLLHLALGGGIVGKADLGRSLVGVSRIASYIFTSKGVVYFAGITGIFYRNAHLPNTKEVAHVAEIKPSKFVWNAVS